MSKVQSVISQFTTEIENAIRADALAQITTALGGAAKKTARPVSDVSSVVRAAKALKRRGGGKGKKRSPEELEATKSSIVSYLVKTPGQTAEQIQKGLGVDLATIALPISKLLKQKKIKKTGNKRATKYFVKA